MEWQQVVIRDKGTIKQFLDAMDLERKKPCSCLHMSEVTFQTKTRSIRVSICDHCFDVRHRHGCTHYKMPKEFYALFQEAFGRVHTTDETQPATAAEREDASAQ